MYSRIVLSTAWAISRFGNSLITKEMDNRRSLICLSCIAPRKAAGRLVEQFEPLSRNVGDVRHKVRHRGHHCSDTQDDNVLTVLDWSGTFRRRCDSGGAHRFAQPEKSGRKWRSKAAQIKPKLIRGATSATNIATVKLASTTSDRRLAMRRLCCGTCAPCGCANTSRSKMLYATSMHTKRPA